MHKILRLSFLETELPTRFRLLVAGHLATFTRESRLDTRANQKQKQNTNIVAGTIMTNDDTWLLFDYYYFSFLDMI